MMIFLRDSQTPDYTGQTAGNNAATVIGTATLGLAGGTFELENILPGQYELFARVPENAGGGSGYTFGRTDVDVIRGRDTANIVINVHPSVSVTGTVTVDSRPGGQVPVRLSLHVDGSAGKIPIYQGIASRAVTSNPETGTFIFPAITAGRFRIAAQGLPGNLYLADVRNTISVFDSGFDVGGEPPQPLEVMLRSGAALVSGTVKDATGRPMPKAAVVLVPMGERRQNRALFHETAADETGSFTIRSIAPGSYKLFSWQSLPPGAFLNPAFLSRYETRGIAVNVVQQSALTVAVNGIRLDEQ
jgi:hypothetical protein